jgi:hypothetical protein
MSKTVKFRRDSPSGGSYLDHQRSDSGVGSFSSDNESRTAYTERGFAGADYDNRDVYSLLAAETSEKQEWMDRAKGWKEKATNLENLLITAHKELKETQARLRAIEDHADEVDEEKGKLTKQNQTLTEKNQTLTEKNQRLEEELKEFKDAKRSSRRKSNSPPSMSGANPAATADAPVEDKKPRRSASRRHSIGREREQERIEMEKERERISREMEKERKKEEKLQQTKEMDRLRKRFNSRAGDEESDANSSKTSKSSRRDSSYIEPMGQSAPRPQVQVPPSPSTARHSQYPSYPNGGYAPPSDSRYAPSSVPRVPVVHPQVVVSYSDAFHNRDEEDGLYHAHPLPRGQRSPDRRERR